MSEQLTEEQKKALSNLIKGHMLVNAFISLKYLLFVILSDIFVVAINTSYVHSASFTFPMVLLNMIFLMHFMLQETAKQRVVFNDEVKKILLKDLEKK
jgi:hypothetical protein